MIDRIATELEIVSSTLSCIVEKVTDVRRWPNSALCYGSNARCRHVKLAVGALIPRTKGRAMAQSAAIPQKACVPNQPKR
jgi:hypothetical protein